MDIIANMLISLKNAGFAGKSEVTIPYSSFKHAIARSLHTAGYIASYERKTREKGGDVLFITLQYREGSKTPRISDVRRLSKSSRRLYNGAGQMRSVRQGFGHVFVTTP